MADMANKGRTFIAPGSKNKNALFTPAQIKRIREFDLVGVTCQEMVSVFGVCGQTIRNITTGLTYKTEVVRNESNDGR